MGKILQRSAFVLVALGCLPAVSQASTRSAYSASTEGEVLVLLNGIRHAHGLSNTGNTALTNGALASPSKC